MNMIFYKTNRDLSNAINNFFLNMKLFYLKKYSYIYISLM